MYELITLMREYPTLLGRGIKQRFFRGAMVDLRVKNSLLPNKEEKGIICLGTISLK